ncbi:hypothetical protein [Marinifilum caeruleilacunae]|uniref:Uncharacterized protein n=1 Tax=Marinifilum caeruleilacunae TaxID=2499076 RepID=A0ABX1WZ24_9BACT|nr:hypothetical protein [Marinifilum caeruleilacunae]NOU61171.1 hypothetical protein [Marinifilum caeruleilacunae]
MAIQIGRFSFRGPFANMDEIKNRPGLFIIHRNEKDIIPIVIHETPLLNASISEELQKKELQLGKDCYVSVYNTFCALQLDREEMIKEIHDLFHLESK